MPKVQFKATELVDARADFVSLVKRGANRLPFRITKEDNEMLDLHKIGRTLFAKADTKPEITAAVVPAGTDMNEVAQVFKDAGLDTKVFLKTEKDGVVTLAKADADKAEQTVIIKTGDKIGLVVAGLQKAFDSYSGSSDFATAVKAQGFYPSFCTAREVLSDCVHVALHKSNSPSEAAEKISKTVEDFQSYMTALASALPASAFYVDRYYADMTKAEAGEETGRTDEEKADLSKSEEEKAEAAGTDATKADDQGEAEKAKADKEKAAAEEAKKADTTDADAAKGGEEIAALKKSQDDIMGALKELQKSITDAVAGVKEDVKKELTDVNSRIEKVAEQAKKTDAALNGTVFAEADGDQPRRVEKADGDRGAPPLLDTAYNRIEAA